MDKFEKIMVGIILGCLFIMLWSYLFIWKTPRPRVVEDEEWEYVKNSHPIEEEETWDSTVTITVYNPVIEQCDSTPLITADNSHIDTLKLQRKEIRWVAVSRDLLKEGHVKFGHRVRIHCEEDPELSGIYEVHDTMNPRYEKHIDILSHKRKLGKYHKVKIEILG